MAKSTEKHRWRFFRSGGFEQVLLDSGEDLMALRELDQKLWAALACPADGIEFDKETLALIDTDNDGRIRVPELLAAIEWTGSVLKDPGTLNKGSSKLPLAAIAGNGEGKRLLSSAKQLLKNLGKGDAAEITIEDTTDRVKIFAEMKFNGDGVIPPESADDEDVQKAIREIIGVTSGVKDRSGKDGISKEKLDEFFAEAEAYSKWLKEAEDRAADVLPLGEGTAAAAEALRAVKAKIDDYFTRVKLAAFDERAAAPLSRDPAEYAALSPKLLSEDLGDVAAFPLARVEPNRPLPLTDGINPAWAAAMSAFREKVVIPLLGEKSALGEQEYRSILGRFAAHEAWRAAKAGARVEPLGKARVRELMDLDYKGKIGDLIAEDQALAPEAEAIASVDKLVRFHRDLYRFARSFVNFRDFYSRKKATFQVGTLYIDGRSCDLCVKVADPAAHAAVAARSGAHLLYCNLERKGTGEKMSIVAAVTAGETDTLIVGRNGIFYDRKGNDWDAHVTKIIENPISIRQAFWMPYRRGFRLIEEQIEKFAASREKEVQAKTAGSIAEMPAVAATPPPAAPAPGAPAPGAPAAPAAPAAFDIAKYAGIFAAIGLAVGAIGTALAALLGGFLGLRWWQMPLVLVGVMLLISGPSMLIAFMKLRRRNIAPILDPSGWAVNAQARLNIPFGTSLTQLAALPRGAERSLEDPYEEKRRPWILYVLLLLLLGAGVYFWRTGDLQKWLDKLDDAPPAATGTAAPSGQPAPTGTAAPAAK